LASVVLIVGVSFGQNQQPKPATVNNVSLHQPSTGVVSFAFGSEPERLLSIWQMKPVCKPDSHRFEQMKD
jgi:hypothetical protein